MRLAAVILLFKEQAFIEATVRALYPVVDSICIASQFDRNLKGGLVDPDGGLGTVLKIPDPENKIRLVLRRDTSGLPGIDDAGRMRNAARMLDSKADYYLVVDADEIWPQNVLRKCWAEVQKSRWAAYRIYSHLYFRKWNYRVVEADEGYRPLAFVKQGFPFANDRQINWRGTARWKEYVRTGRKPKTVYFPRELRLHHGSCVGDDARILTKLTNFSHSEAVDPEWFERVWKDFHPGIRNFHYFRHKKHLYQSVQTVPTSDLPEEITRCVWPPEWVD